jgi:hypothetical protein
METFLKYQHWLSVNCERRKTKLNVQGVEEYMFLEKDKQQASKP